jgi:hypothetical protein
VFDLVRPKALADKPGCVPYASGKVSIEKRDGVEVMRMFITGLPKDTEFDVFVIQKPAKDFGLSWYQGDIKTRYHFKSGQPFGYQRFIGRFNEETFIVAPGSVPAPIVHNNAFPDTNTNPVTPPVHQFHIGVWFNSPADAKKAGCPATVTPFNGEHNAGIQVLNTSNFADDKGPLFFVKP